MIARRRSRPRRTLKVADLFCGAGGTSEGARIALQALGFKMQLTCVNHWKIAIDTHTVNHPDAIHICQDIASVRPRVAVPDGYLDLLIAAPSCTFHSSARGGLPMSDQQRMDPWHIVTWLTELDVRALLVENVPEFVKWGPVDPVTERPIKALEGTYFNAWVEAIRSLGFRRIEWRKVNAANYGEAQTRVRFMMMAWRDERPIPWAVETHASPDEWRPAAEIIDWSIPGKSIFNRPKPLARATLERILDGAERHDWEEPFLVILRRHMAGKSIRGPMPTISAQGTHIGIAQAFTLSQGSNGAPRSTTRPVATLVGQGRVALVRPFVLSQGTGGAARSVKKPIPAIPGGGAHALIAPYYGSGSGTTCRSTRAPISTLTGKARFGLVLPVTHTDSSGRARSTRQPTPTITGAHRGELALAQPGVDWDILYRMLQPHELAAAQGFDFDRDYRFIGVKQDVIKQIGNAVPVRVAAALIGALVQGMVE